MNSVFGTTMNLRPLLILCLGLLLAACEDLAKPSKSIEVAKQGNNSASLSRHGRLAVIGSINHGGSLWLVNSAERKFNWNHSKDKTTLVASAFSPEGDWAMSTDSHTLVLWNTKTGTALRFWTAPGEVLSIALGPKGNYALLGMSDHSAVIFDAKRGGVKRSFYHQGRVRSVDISSDGKLALTGSEDHTAVLWDIRSGKALHTFAHDEDVQLVRLSERADKALTAAKYDKAVIWNLKTGKSINQIPLSAEKVKRGLRFSAARFNPAGNRLLIGRPDQRVQLWDLGTMKVLKQWKMSKRDPWKPTAAAVQDVAFARKDGQYISVASNGFIQILE